MSQISSYPNFSPLTLDHQREISAFTAKFPPYSDFNFTSLYAWDTTNEAGVAALNNNLVIKIPDYITGEPVYSVIGTSSIDGTLERLLLDHGELIFVPDITVESIVNHSKFIISDDRDNYDYIYRLKDLIELSGKGYKVKRNKHNSFLRNYSEALSLRNIRFDTEEDRSLILDITESWRIHRQRPEADANNEAIAISRLLKNYRNFKLTGILVYIREKCVGFTINEVIDDRYAICHFQKSILSYEHIDVFLSLLSVKELYHFGCEYVNWEQDLGDEGLRTLKNSYQPSHYLKKHSISLNKLKAETRPLREVA